jgi:formylglycine-generating enzyme required for sulfatase activity
VPCEPLDVALRVEGFSVDAASRRVTPRDGVVADARFALTPLPAQFTVACAAPGAEVFDVNGARVCPVGAAMSLQPFTAYTLTVRAPRRRPATVVIPALAPEAKEARQVALEEQKEPNPGEEMTVDLGGGVKLTLFWCPAGNFLMGSPSDEADRGSEETQHRVTLTKGFWMGKYEVTQGQWERVMGSNPSWFTGAGANAPVEKVSWDDCQEFVRKVNGLVSGGGFRLPTEAEWEYACRAGTTGPYAGNVDDLGWYGGNSDGATHPVGRKKANAWNLYDMHGNVWEWCSDWYGECPSGGVSDPSGPGSGSCRVYRGGSWFSYAWNCRSANRGGNVPGYRDSFLGLRLARSPP